MNEIISILKANLITLMLIFRSIINSLLMGLPIAILIRDWKFHDKRTIKYHIITKVIIVLWIMVIAIYFYLDFLENKENSSRVKELIDRQYVLSEENKKLSIQIGKYQKAMLDRFDKMEESMLRDKPQNPSEEEVKKEMGWDIGVELEGKKKEALEEYRRGVLSFDKNSFSEAITHFENSLKIIKIPSFYFTIGTSYVLINQDELALENYEAALNLYKEKGNKKGEADSLNNIGSIYGRKGELDSALKYYQQSLEISREIGYKQGEAIRSINIGSIYERKGELDEALKYYQQSLEISKEAGYRKCEADSLNNIGSIYGRKGELDSALKYYQQSLEISREIGYKQGEAIRSINIGSIYERKGELDEALKYYQQSLEISKEVGYKQGEAISLNNIKLIKEN